ncbi:MAG: glycosyltransferase family 2 protein [Candidatus Bathyarchaeota archaeon]|nr:MAG: glycosyltransferase family 2 protein [Candidatus Bathyarchaeota archaeon]
MIDIVLLTYNSLSTLGNTFKCCLQQALRNASVNRIIVVDGGSKDSTIEYVRKVTEKNDIKLILIEDIGGTRASSRQKGIEHVETDWFLFLDSDCVLCDNWLNKVQKDMLNPSIGAIQGTTIKMLNNFSRSYICVREAIKTKFKGKLIFGPIEHIVAPAEERGFMGNTLIRTETIRDIKIPFHLHIFEDYYIKNHITRKGYQYVITKEAYCQHHVKMHRLRDAYYVGYLYTKTKKLTVFRAVLNLLTVIPKTLLVTTKVEIILYQIRYYVNRLSGSIAGLIGRVR